MSVNYSTFEHERPVAGPNVREGLWARIRPVCRFLLNVRCCRLVCLQWCAQAYNDLLRHCCRNVANVTLPFNTTKTCDMTGTLLICSYMFGLYLPCAEYTVPFGIRIKHHFHVSKITFVSNTTGTFLLCGRNNISPVVQGELSCHGV